MCNRHAIHVFEQLKRHVTQRTASSLQLVETCPKYFRLEMVVAGKLEGYIAVSLKELEDPEVHISFGYFEHPIPSEDTEHAMGILKALALGATTLQAEKERLEADWVCQPLSTLRR